MRTNRTWTDEKGRTYRDRACERCGGTGTFSWMTGVGRASGICFRCGGDGVDPRPARVYSEEELAKRERQEQRRIAKRQAEAQAREAARLAWIAEHQALVDQLNEANQDRWPHPTLSFLASAVAHGPLSEAHTRLASTLLEERAARLAEEAAAPAWTAGRQEVEGVVLAKKWVEAYGGRGWRPRVAAKILVKTDDGREIYLTAPSAILGCERGDRVRFTVQAEPKLEEPHFAFGRRPTKAEIVSAKAEPETEAPALNNKALNLSSQ